MYGTRRANGHGTHDVTFTVVSERGIETEHTIQLPVQHDRRDVLAAVAPYVGKGLPLHVAVIDHGRHVDLFVAELATIHGAPPNRRLSRVYRANYLAGNPDTPPDQLHAIHGTGALFHEPVWNDRKR